MLHPHAQAFSKPALPQGQNDTNYTMYL